ncbi:MAG TPA: aminopeptidase P family N-terminal domain-containing protein, partial [Candidatus Sulfopaludibacter sp.]|nr:aminopeptidase P family N-terminal domain-containing protein [Candidatus Sulfopaludibacter sp.]
MRRIERRVFLATSAAGIAGLARAQNGSTPEAIRNLRPMLEGIVPISDGERRARIDKSRRLMHEHKIDALVLEGGASMFYFTGTRPAAGDPLFLLVIPAAGDLKWIVPAAAAARAHEASRVGGDIRPWEQNENPYRRVAQALGAASRIAIEEKTRFTVFDNLRRELPAAEFVSGDPMTVACRVIKSPAEIALMQRANDITIAAY